jgi:hypothetical protein
MRKILLPFFARYLLRGALDSVGIKFTSKKIRIKRRDVCMALELAGADRFYCSVKYDNKNSRKEIADDGLYFLESEKKIILFRKHERYPHGLYSDTFEDIKDVINFIVEMYMPVASIAVGGGSNVPASSPLSEIIEEQDRQQRAVYAKLEKYLTRMDSRIAYNIVARYWRT